MSAIFTTHPITSTSPPPIPSLPTLFITNLTGTQTLDSTLSDASRFIAKNYGHWSQNPRLRRPGRPIKMSPRRLHAEVFPRHLRHQAQIVRALRLEAADADKYCGHVIAVNWVTPAGTSVCWITQMVVKEDLRSMGLAEAMLREVRRSALVEYDVAGIVSCHPHAIMAVCRAFAKYGVEELDLEFMRERAAGCMAACPVKYVREGKLHGTLWGVDVGGVAVASVDTEFMVEEQPLREAMRSIFEHGRRWPLGALPEGHEWLCMVKTDWSEPELVSVPEEAIDPQLLAVDGTIDPRLTVVDTSTS